MPYRQIDYSQHTGNGPYPLSATGCVVTSFSNLLEEFGISINPASLNDYFNAHGVFLPSPEDGAGTRDDLGWGSISAFDGRVVVTTTGGGWPSTNHAIVKFEYVSHRTGQRSTHFCKVADYSQQTILDSYDGVTRSPGYYGSPVAYATYELHAPQVVTPPVHPETAAFDVTILPAPKQITLTADPTHLWDLNQRTWSALSNNPVGSTPKNTEVTVLAEAHHALGGLYYMPDPGTAQGYNEVDTADYFPPVVAPPAAPDPLPAPSSPANIGAPILATSKEIYKVVNNVPGYMTANYAVNRVNASTNVGVGDYYIYNKMYGMVNVTLDLAYPGSWINTADNVIPAPVLPPVVPEKPKLVIKTTDWNAIIPPSTPPLPTIPSVPVAPPVDEWKASFSPNTEKPLQIYTAIGTGWVNNLETGERKKQFNAGDQIPVIGTVVKDSTVFARIYKQAASTTNNDDTSWFGIPMSIDGISQHLIELKADVYNTTTTLAERQALRTLSTYDYIELFINYIKKLTGVGKNKN